MVLDSFKVTKLERDYRVTDHKSVWREDEIVSMFKVLKQDRYKTLLSNAPNLEPNPENIEKLVSYESNIHNKNWWLNSNNSNLNLIPSPSQSYYHYVRYMPDVSQLQKANAWSLNDSNSNIDDSPSKSIKQDLVITIDKDTADWASPRLKGVVDMYSLIDRNIELDHEKTKFNLK